MPADVLGELQRQPERHQQGRHALRGQAEPPDGFRVYLADGMDEQGFDSMMEEFGARYLLGRVGEPEDVAELAAFLVSEQAGWMTGSVIPVDSGYRSVGFTQQ